MAVAAGSVIRFVPYIYLVSPSTCQEVKLRLDVGLQPIDALDLAQRCLTATFIDSPAEVLGQARLVNLLAMAEDWRFMTEGEIGAFLSRDVLEEAGIRPPDMPEDDGAVEDEKGRDDAD